MKAKEVLENFKLPTLPIYILNKRISGLCFPIDDLTDKEIKEMYKQMAIATIERKNKRKISVDSI